MDTLNFDRVRGTRIFEEVATRIREMLTSGELKPGDKLPAERDLCQRFGIGRNALREALRTLEIAGVLELRLGKSGGAFVTSGNPKVVSDNMRDLLRLGNISFDHLTEARMMVTEMVVRAAVARITAADIEAMKENIRQAELLYEQGRLMEKTHMNIEFHNILARATKNPILVILTHTLTDLFGYFVRRLGSETSRETFLSRNRFMKAVEGRDVEKAVIEMQRNLRKVHRLYGDLASQAQGNTPATTSKKPILNAKVS